MQPTRSDFSNVPYTRSAPRKRSNSKPSLCATRQSCFVLKVGRPSICVPPVSKGGSVAAVRTIKYRSLSKFGSVFSMRLTARSWRASKEDTTRPKISCARQISSFLLVPNGYRLYAKGNSHFTGHSDERTLFLIECRRARVNSYWASSLKDTPIF